ncbi:hypothetical protein F4703DRAFT_1857654, partial [Phycomyces blakesleeanus]
MFTSKLPIISILQTVLLGYISHVVTIRPRTGVSKFPTGYRRFIALVYPSSGIGLAVESMYKSFQKRYQQNSTKLKQASFTRLVAF